MGKAFIIVGKEEIQHDILVRHANRYGKQHANGILELFRRTKLQNGDPAWRPVHKVPSRVNVDRQISVDEMALAVIMCGDGPVGSSWPADWRAWREQIDTSRRRWMG